MFPFPDPELDIIDSVSGVLMMQDIQLGTIMALIPFLEGGVSEEGFTYQYNVVMWVLRCLQILVGFPALVVILRFLAMRTVARLYRWVGREGWIRGREGRGGRGG